MTKEQYSTNLPSESQTNGSEDLLNTSLPPRIGPYRSLSAKRPRDPSHRKSVSFNDVPIVYEVPSHDSMRNSNCDTYRSWTYTEATPPTSAIPSFYSSQIFSPFNSSNAAAQKLHANRLCSTLYSTPPTTMTATTTTTTTVTPNRIPDWAIRPKTTKTTSNTDEFNTSSENNWNSPLIIVQAPDDRTNKDTSVKLNNQSAYSSLHTFHSQQLPTTPASSLAENGDEKKYPYRSALIPDTEHHRSLPFTYGPLSDSTATYTSMLSTNLIQSNHSSNEQPSTGYTRAARARSATLPGTANHSAVRTNDTVSIMPFRATTTALLSNGSGASARTILRPTTIAFQCSQPSTTATTNTISSSPATITTTAANNNAYTNPSSVTTTTSSMMRPPPVPQRIGSAAAASTAHSRFVLPPHRTFSTNALTSSALKYAFAHPTMDSTLNTTMPSHTTMSKPPPTAYPRARSANVFSTRRTVPSPVVMLDGQSNGGTTINSNANLYATAKRNPNVRQTYGSYYMHRVLLPTTIN